MWWRRGDVREALLLLSSDVPALTPSGMDPRWPSLTEAIHWLVDDTWWDLRDPSDDVGVYLRSSAEADALRLLVRAIMDVHDRHGPLAPHAAWYGDPAWPQVQALARQALTIFDAPESP